MVNWSPLPLALIASIGCCQPTSATRWALIRALRGHRFAGRGFVRPPHQAPLPAWNSEDAREGRFAGKFIHAATRLLTRFDTRRDRGSSVMPQ
jgi:hypothetical protein